MTNSSIITDHPLAKGCPSEWASEWGEDEYGPWCGFTIGGVSQRLRWIPTGQFIMGSPDTEEGRDGDEGPQHWVTVFEGFWLFDSPCTQALWEVVMQESPCRFKGVLRPVERVSWDDCHDFMKRLNQQVNGLNLRLPTEAEWEYSCRSGNADSRYADLGEIAWFAGNSDGQTHDVKQKLPNAWGAYDMLGNVREWCRDSAYRQYTDETLTDPQYASDTGGSRVIRGGSWNRSARFVRAAYRNALPPEARFRYLGFRCLSSPEPVR